LDTSLVFKLEVWLSDCSSVWFAQAERGFKSQKGM